MEILGLGIRNAGEELIQGLFCKKRSERVGFSEKDRLVRFGGRQEDNGSYYNVPRMVLLDTVTLHHTVVIKLRFNHDNCLSLCSMNIPTLYNAPNLPIFP